MKLAAYVLGVLGIFFILDALFLKSITMDYNVFGLGFFDPLFSHFYLGLFLIIIVIIDLKYGGK